MTVQVVRGAGGKFAGSIGGVPVPPSMARLFGRLGAAAGGSMSFNGRTGTGYGVVGGDPRVAMLQRALKRLGITDGGGHPLKVDGKLGPLTTAAVKTAQQRLGVRPDGVVTPKLMAQILGMPKPAAGAKPAHPRTARQMMRRHH